jgi:hypothetical protein
LRHLKKNLADTYQLKLKKKIKVYKKYINKICFSHVPNYIVKKVRRKTSQNAVFLVSRKKSQQNLFKKIYKNKTFTKKHILSLLNFFEQKILKKNNLFVSLKRLNRKRRDYVLNKSDSFNHKITLCTNLVPRTKLIHQFNPTSHLKKINTISSLNTKQIDCNFYTNPHLILNHITNSFFFKSYLVWAHAKSCLKIKLIIWLSIKWGLV